MAIKKTLLQIVQGILSDLDSEEVNSISDSVEASQVASFAEDVFYEIVSTRIIPEHKGLIKLTAASDTNTPTHFSYPTNVKDIDCVWYDKSTGGTFEYGVVYWMEPIEFLNLVDGRSSNYTSVSDLNAGTNLRIYNDRMPHYYTSFDDENIVMDAHDSTIDTTLQESKVRAYGTTIPVFSQTDSYTPDIDGVMFPYYISELRTRCFDQLKGGTTPVVDRAARRQKAYIQNDKHRTRKANVRNGYGRN